MNISNWNSLAEPRARVPVPRTKPDDTLNEIGSFQKRPTLSDATRRSTTGKELILGQSTLLTTQILNDCILDLLDIHSPPRHEAETVQANKMRIKNCHRREKLLLHADQVVAHMMRQRMKKQHFDKGVMIVRDGGQETVSLMVNLNVQLVMDATSLIIHGQERTNLQILTMTDKQIHHGDVDHETENMTDKKLNLNGLMLKLRLSLPRPTLKQTLSHGCRR